MTKVLRREFLLDTEKSKAILGM